MPYKDRLKHNEAQKQRYHRVRKEIRESLYSSFCVKCGSQDSLEFDHIDPRTKSFNIGSKYASVSRENLDKELQKCQVLCQPCHQDKTGRASCGTRSAYTRGCRCDLCKLANTNYYKEKRLFARRLTGKATV